MNEKELQLAAENVVRDFGPERVDLPPDFEPARQWIKKSLEAPAEGYNGWKNYETWAVALWIDNDEGTYHYRREMTEEARIGAPRASQVVEGVWTAEQAARFNLADALKEWVTDALMPELEASLASDLLGAALSEVDWDEIAENYLSEE